MSAVVLAHRWVYKDDSVSDWVNGDCGADLEAVAVKAGNRIERAYSAPVADQDRLDAAREEHWRVWAIPGMPKDKIKLAEETWRVAVDAASSGVSIDDMQARLSSLIERIRPGCEVAPWVYESLATMVKQEPRKAA